VSTSLLARLTELDVRLGRDGDRLLVDGPEGVLDDALVAEIAASKPALFAALGQDVGRPPTDGQDVDWTVAEAPDRGASSPRSELSGSSRSGSAVGQSAGAPCLIRDCNEETAVGDLVYCVEHRRQADDGTLWRPDPNADPPEDRVATIESLGPPLDRPFIRLHELGAQIRVKDGQPHYVGRKLAADDPIHAMLAENRELLVELFTYAPDGRCASPGCYRLRAPGDPIACPDHRREPEGAFPAGQGGAGRAGNMTSTSVPMARPTDPRDGESDSLVATSSLPAPHAQVGLATLYVGDSAEVLAALPPGSAGLVGGSPPYALGKDYGTSSDTTTYEDWLQWLGTVSRAAWQSLEDGGRYVLNIPFDTNLQFDADGRKRSSKQPVLADVIHLLVRVQGWTFNALINWDEGNVSRRTAWGSYGMPTDPWVILPAEAILVLSKGARKREARGRTWDLLPEEHKDWSLATWKFPGESAKRVGHPAPFPIELPYRVIKLFSFKEDLVIDPWAGSGTTNLAASRLGRRNIYIDVNPDFAELALGRLSAGGIQ
jgi:site-specific DNA-methyltransferase (adenine-specific)